MEPKTERFEMRLEQSALENIDTWRAKQPDMPSRAEAIRRLIETGLENEKPRVKINDGERLLFMMLRDMYKSMKIKGEIDPDFVASAIYGGHYWGLEWQYNGLFHRHENVPATVTEVVDVLDMWSFLEAGCKKLSAAEKERLKKEAEPFGSTVTFVGFDGNNETERLSIARFLIDDLGRFSQFKGRDLNSHRPTVDAYNRMLHVFKDIRPTLVGRSLSVEEIISIFKAKAHPDYRQKNRGGV
jgi:uncharacterized protein YfbU (UPF0304 family)